jgi:hypothetical protein
MFWSPGKERHDGRSPIVCLPENQAKATREAPG